MRALAFVVTLGSLALGSASASAQAIPSKCNAAKFKATGAYAQAIVACQAKAIAKGSNLDLPCLARAAAKLEKAFEKAAKKDDCGGSGAAPTAKDQADQFRIALGEQVLPELRCCAVTIGASEQCRWAASDTACTDDGGTPGAEGSDCNSDGECTTGSLSSGPCCELDGVCTAGQVDINDCTGAGGAFVASGTCLASGECLPH
jgi:hypothetical protein